MTNKLPEKLSALRRYFSFAQLDVASKIGVPVSEYMKWENGNSVCSIEVLRRIAKLYDVDVQDLFINDRELKMPDVELPYASVEIPFVEQTKVEEENENLMQAQDDYDAYDDDIETTKEIGTEEDLGKTRVIGTDTLQATTIMKIQDEPKASSSNKNTSKNKSKKTDPKKLGIIIGSAVVVVALVIFLVTRLFGGSSESSLSVSSEKRVVSADTYSAYITNKGKLVTSGSTPTLSDFEDIVQIDTDGSTLFALKKNGTVLSTSSLPSEVSKWKNITSIAMSETHYVGVKESGEVVCSGSDSACKVDDWKDISKVYAGDDFTIGITTGGRIEASGNLDIKDTLTGLSGIKNVSIGDNEIAVLFTSGKVNTYSLTGGTSTNTSAWSNISAVAVGKDYVVGLTDKETVVVATTDDDLTKETSKWAGIKYIAANGNTIIAVNSSDQIIGAGDNTYNQYTNLSDVTPTPTTTSTTLPALSSVQNIKFNVSSTGVTINWDTVLNASYYEVSVNTSPTEIKIKSASNSASVGVDKLKDGQTYKVTIVAYPKDTEQYSASTATSIDYVYSALVKKLSAPTNVKYTLSGKTFTFTWDAVENATSYTFAIGTWEQETTSTTITVDASSMTNGASETAYLSAKSSDSKYSESDATSIKFTYTAPATPLATPTITSKNVNIESGDLTITWTKDAYASNYSITVGDKQFTSDSGTLVIKADQLSNNTEYRIVITANPKDTNNYSASTYEENYKYEYTTVVTPEPTSTTDSEG